jgi:hypothetical protein
MKKCSMVLLALIGFLGLSAGARAQDSTVVAKIPYEFVAGSKTFPAGTYTITRVSPEALPTLQIRNHETSQNSVFLLPVSSAVAVDHPQLSFEHVGDTYYLGRIATLAGVYILPTPKGAANMGKAKQSDAVSFAGTN